MQYQLAIASLMMSVSTFGCAVYKHDVEIVARDPHQVWVEAGANHTRVEPPGPEHAALLPGTRDRVERTGDGVLKINGRTVVGRNGVLPSPPTLDEASQEMGSLRVPVCTKRGRDGACRRWTTLVTPMENLEVAREADVPSTTVGVLTLGGGIAAGVLGGIASARDPHSSGGGLLISLGAVAALFGIVQLAQPIQNERDLLP